MKDTYCLDIRPSTVSLWLHNMGFSYKQFSKGVYFDGHEREDVVEERKAYLAKLASCSQRISTAAINMYLHSLAARDQTMSVPEDRP